MEENNLPAQTGLEIYLSKKIVGENNDGKITTNQRMMFETLIEHFKPFETQAAEWSLKARSLKVTDISQVEEMKQAGIGRKALVKVRTGIKDTHQVLKADSLNYGRLLDGIKTYLTDLNLPTEEYLREQEEFAERQQAKEKAELKEQRIALLAPYEIDENFYPMLDTMDQTLFDKLLSDSKILFDAKKAAAEKEAEEKRLSEEKEAREKKEREQAAQIENERLKKEQAEKEALHKKRNEELKPYIMFIRDYSALLNASEEDYQLQLKEIDTAAKQHMQYEADEKVKKEAQERQGILREQEAEKQRQELLKAAEERTSERKKALFALGLAETNGKMAFGDIMVSADIIKDMESEPWGNYLTNVTNNVNAAKEKIEADRIAKEKADAEELEASKGDKEKFKNLHFELDALKKKYSAFKSKKHQKLSSEVNGLIQKIQDYITLKN